MDGWMDGKDGGEDVFVLCAPGREWTLCGNGDRPWRTAVFVHPPICLLAVCVNAADVCFLPPQARRWRGCTGWQGRTWHRWRLWCSAWARPPSPSSSPSHASSPPCEGGQKKTLDELKDRRWERTRLSSSSRPGLWRAEEAGIALDLWGWMQERAPPGVSALLLPQSHCSPEGTQCRPACLCVGERHQAETAPSSASGRESHVCGCFQSNITVSCQQPFSGTSRCLCGHWLWRLSVALVGGKKKTLFSSDDDLMISDRTKSRAVRGVWGSEDPKQCSSAKKNTLFFSVKHQPHLQIIIIIPVPEMFQSCIINSRARCNFEFCTL